jgi:predicted nucleic acid-binding protein
MTSKIAVGDADSLIALVCRQDSNHNKAVEAIDRLVKDNIEIVYPNTAILEAIVALRRGLNLPQQAKLLNLQYQQGVFTVEYTDEEVQLKASKRWETTDSKQNTIFDAIVAEMAVKLKAEVILSFDEWYKKQGFKLV